MEYRDQFQDSNIKDLLWWDDSVRKTVDSKVTTATVKSHLVIKLKNHHWSKPEQIKDEPSEAVASKAAESEEPMKVEENPKAKSKPDNFVIVHLFPVVNIFEAIDRQIVAHEATKCPSNAKYKSKLRSLII